MHACILCCHCEHRAVVLPLTTVGTIRLFHVVIVSNSGFVFFSSCTESNLRCFFNFNAACSRKDFRVLGDRGLNHVKSVAVLIKKLMSKS